MKINNSLCKLVRCKSIVEYKFVLNTTVYAVEQFTHSQF